MSEQEHQAGKGPALIAYQPVETKARTFWNRVGAAWPTESGEGYRVQLNSFPVDGVFVLLPPRPREDGGGEQG